MPSLSFQGRRRFWLAGTLVLLPVLSLPACRAEPTGVLPSSVGALGSEGGGSMSPPPGQAIVDVSIQDFSFAPRTITLRAGTTVRWTNNGPSAHTTTSDAGVWGSPVLSPPISMGTGAGYGGMGGSGMGGGGMGGMDGGTGTGVTGPGASFQVTFTQAGTYSYHCSIHPPSMYPGFTGSITVTP